MRRPLLVSAAFAGLLLAAPLSLWGWLQVDRSTLTGIRVEGRPLPPTGDPARTLQRDASAWLDTEVLVRAGPEVVSATRRELGARIDVSALGTELRSVGRSGNVIRDVLQWMRARRGDVAVRWPVRVDRSATSAFLASLQRRVDREPVEGRVDGSGRLASAPAPGVRLLVIEADAALSRALEDRETAVELPVEAVAAPALPAPAPARRFSVVLGTYTTRFSPGGNRGHNVRRATGLLDGAVVEPGDDLSFNNRIGPRSRSAGFRIAHVIQGGEMVDGLGGGTCQVASTLHAAAFLAGFGVVEHQPHSRPSDYIPMGLDATVVWPSVDLVLHNPYAYPVRVRASTEGRELTVALLGARSPPRVSWSRRVLSRLSPGERFVEDPEVPEGGTVVSQEALPGFVVQRTRVIEDGVRAVTEEEVLRYPATDRVVRIPPKGSEG